MSAIPADFDRDGVVVCCEQALITPDELDAILTEFGPLPSDAADAWNENSAFYGCAGAASDSSSMYGDQASRIQGLQHETLTAAVNLATAIRSADEQHPSGGKWPRTPAEVVCELHEAVSAIAEQPDLCVLAGPAGPPVAVERSAWAAVCEPVTSATFAEHALISDMEIPDPGSEWGRLLDNRMAMTAEETADNYDSILWLPEYSPAMDAAITAASGDRHDQAAEQAWPTLLEYFASQIGALAWHQAATVHASAEQFLTEPDLASVLAAVSRYARACWLSRRLGGICLDEAVPAKLRAQCVMAALHEHDSVEARTPEAVVAMWMGRQLSERAE